jgi:hypothetical protein
MRTISLLVIFSLQSIQLCAQSEKKVKQFSMVPAAGIIWQGTYNFNFGVQPMLLLDAKKDHSNIGLLIMGNLLYRDRTLYLTPVTRLKIMPHKRKKFVHLAWFASIGHSYTKIDKKYDHRITPELGIKWEGFNLSVGYNVPVSAYQDEITNSIRVALTLNLF